MPKKHRAFNRPDEANVRIITIPVSGLNRGKGELGPGKPHPRRNKGRGFRSGKKGGRRYRQPPLFQIFAGSSIRQALLRTVASMMAQAPATNCHFTSTPRRRQAATVESTGERLEKRMTFILPFPLMP